MPARQRILLVNDDEDALFLLSRSLRRAMPEAEVALLENPIAALKYFREHHVDAIVTDNTMPQMDGLTFVRNVRERDARIPVLMVTNSMHISADAAAAGVTRYLPCARWDEVGSVMASLLEESAGGKP